MNNWSWRRRTGWYVVGLVVSMILYAVAYHYGMQRFEGADPTFLHSLQVIVETYTTTGFGSDAPWTSPEMNLLVILIDLTGVALIFLALPVLLFPLMEEALSTTIPTSVDQELEDHVVICTYTSRADTLLDELASWGVETAVIEPDRETAERLYKEGTRVVHADPEATEGLRRGGLPRARALIADVSDTVDVSIVLAAREVADDVPAISVAEDPAIERYHRLAGADTVISPRPLLGRSLANKASSAVSTDLGDAIEIGDDIEIVELPVRPGSELIGETLAGSDLREKTGVNVIGLWKRGRFQSPPEPSVRLDTETILLVAGRQTQLERLKGLTQSDTRRIVRGETIVVGFGRVGRAVCESLASADVPYAVLDREDAPGVDVVGDATDPGALREVGVETARTVILAVPDDTVAEFASLVVADCNPDAEILARADEVDSVPKMYRAGIDYVLSLPTVTGRMLASTIIEGEEVLSPDTQVEVVRTDPGSLTGRTLSNADVRARTGVTVVGVERDGEVHAELGPDFRFDREDTLIIAGTDAGINRFTETFAGAEAA